MKSLNNIKVITLVSALVALSVVGRTLMAGIPNVQPSTFIIIIISMVFGFRFGLYTTILTVIISNMYLGFGIWVVGQIIAWGFIAFISAIFGRIYYSFPYRSVGHIFITAFTGLCGYIFGFTISFHVFLAGGLEIFIGYWIAGLPFDTYHAVGNVLFYFFLAPILLPFLEKQRKQYFRRM